VIVVHFVDRGEDVGRCAECGEPFPKEVTYDRTYYDAPPLGYRACNEKKKRKAS